MYYVQKLATVAAFVAMFAATWLSIQWARADQAFRTQTPEGTSFAVRLAPHHLTYQTAAALQAEYDGEDPSRLLTETAAAHPRASAPRIQLGLAAEIRGGNAEAERWLLDAFRVDKTFDTRWTLANFYFRQGREDEFWTWIRSALEMSYLDRRPAFDLCWRASEDPALILERAIPPREEVQAAYLWFLMGEKRESAIADAAMKLAEWRNVAYYAPLYAAIDTLLGSEHYREATRIWETMGYASQAHITNGEFADPILDTGFDWRRIQPAGVTHITLDAGRGHRVRLSGNQPEQTELLRQWLGGLQPGTRYRLQWNAIVDGVESGVSWNVAGVKTPVTGNGELVFTAPAEAAALSLVYARPQGEVRAEGSIDIQRVALSTF